METSVKCFMKFRKVMLDITAAFSLNISFQINVKNHHDIKAEKSFKVNDGKNEKRRKNILDVRRCGVPRTD